MVLEIAGERGGEILTIEQKALADSWRGGISKVNQVPRVLSTYSTNNQASVEVVANSLGTRMDA